MRTSSRSYSQEFQAQRHKDSVMTWEPVKETIVRMRNGAT